MKKIFLAICLLLIFSTTTANAYTVFVGIDDSIDLTSVSHFEFDVSCVTPDPSSFTIYYQDDTVEVGGVGIYGAVPSDISGLQIPWRIDLNNGCINGSGALNFNLNSGIILSFEASDACSLDNFILKSPGEAFNIIETSIEGGKLYTYSAVPISGSLEGGIKGAKECYANSAVPIPGSLVLLGSGLIGLIGLGRKRMRK